MSRRGEPVPFALVAESERFRGDVTPPPRAHRDPRRKAGGVLLGLTVVAGLVGAVLLGGPALDVQQQRPVGVPAAGSGR